MNQEREPLPTRVRDLPPMTAGDLAGLQSDLAAGLAGLGLSSLAPDVRTRLIDHVRLLLAWNEAINLTAIRSPEAALREHVLDSLAAVPVLRGRALDALLDLGSGGGFPGIPLALVLPARRTLLVESVAKKAAFLTAAAGIVAGDAGRAADRCLCREVRGPRGRSAASRALAGGGRPGDRSAGRAVGAGPAPGRAGRRARRLETPPGRG